METLHETVQEEMTMKEPTILNPTARGVKRRGPFAFLSTVAALVAAAGMATAATEADSNSTFVFLDYGESAFWHTATNATLSLPLPFPAGASGATLTVSAPKYAAQYEIAAGNTSFVLSLPIADSPAAENVYDLSLDFGEGTVLTAKLGLVESYGPHGDAATRVLAPSTRPAWPRVGCVAVIPIPAGITAFTIDGVTADTGLDGDAGWYAAVLGGGQTATFALTDAEGSAFSATLFRPREATTFVLR